MTVIMFISAGQGVALRKVTDESHIVRFIAR